MTHENGADIDPCLEPRCQQVKAADLAVQERASTGGVCQKLRSRPRRRPTSRMRLARSRTAEIVRAFAGAAARRLPEAIQHLELVVRCDISLK